MYDLPVSLFSSMRLMRPERLMELSRVWQDRLPVRREQSGDSPERGLMWLSGGKARTVKQVAVVPVSGIIDQKRSEMMDFFGGTATDDLSGVLEMLDDDPQVKGVILDMDTPGGTDRGLRELSQQMFDMRTRKPLVAVSNSEMNSAGYWLGSSTSKVIVTPGSMTGSVGVWSMAVEYTKALESDGVKVHLWRAENSPFKAEFLPWSEFTKESVDFEQSEVNRVGVDFVKAVARNRGVTPSEVTEKFGKGRTFGADYAVLMGLADRKATLKDVVRRMMDGRMTLSTLNGNMDQAFSDDPAPVVRRFGDVDLMRRRLELARR